ncbi:MAG: hypothetical protein V4793_41440 [Paraburkholderia tropica]|uniref:Uncharacterized protein n=1 Tax=Paraburkholderia tropica TaxID=92647 RepID=A0ABX5MUK1_9BURK|nr:hypothetical protein [Paraburkholderia tropica]MBB2999216.1 hypothetical protein [Paraburkholderia tropica]MBB6318884.1 hypothetical protein [Paraburkholderia tropica]MDE1138944.1 hypothetical protein [Paraburkholderia tropica]PXX18687.1 hypothetical protein C7400_104197 [Paraburkholderia tropica]PZW87219.1 hypothetical protein C7399_104196 [Paraburkholderia tropica]
MNDHRKRTEDHRKRTEERAREASQPATPESQEEAQSVKHPRHEGGEPVGSRHPHEPRSVGVQGHRDLERGLEDTDRRGGDAYQSRTQNDAQANRNAKPRRG